MSCKLLYNPKQMSKWVGLCFLFTILLLVSCKTTSHTSSGSSDTEYYEFYKEDSGSRNGYMYATLEINAYSATYKATGSVYAGNAKFIEIEGKRIRNWRVAFQPTYITIEGREREPVECYSSQSSDQIEIEYNYVEQKDRILLLRYLAREMLTKCNFKDLFYNYGITDFPPYMIRVKKINEKLFKK